MHTLKCIEKPELSYPSSVSFAGCFNFHLNIVARIQFTFFSVTVFCQFGRCMEAQEKNYLNKFPSQLQLVELKMYSLFVFST